MATSVRAYTFAGTIAAPQSSSSGAMITNGQWMLKYPYLYAQVLSVGTGSPAATDVSTLAPNDAQTVKLVFIQVQPGKRVHLEVTPGGQDLRPATVNSPIIQNDLITVFGPGWRISVLEADPTA